MITEATRRQFDRNVLPRLRALGRHLRAYLLLDGVAVVSVAMTTAILITLLVDYTFHLAWDMRLVQWLTLLTVIVYLVWKRMYRPLSVPVHPQQLAVLIERRFPRLRSQLVSAVEFADPTPVWPTTSARSPAMADAVVRQAQSAVADMRFTEILAHNRARRRVMVIVGCLAGILLLTLLLPATMGLWFQRDALLQDVDWPQRNRLMIEGLTNGKILVPRGEDVSVSAVVAKGYQAPRQAYILYERPDGIRAQKQMPAATGQDTRFSHTFERVTESLRCQIIGGDAETEPFTIEVVDRPQVAAVMMHVTPPAYTQMQGYDLRSGQTVAEVLRGSRIHFRIATNKPVLHATLVRQIADKTEPLAHSQTLSDREFIADDVPPASATYYFHLVDAIGLDNLSGRVSPVRMSIRLLADKPPTVKMNVKTLGAAIAVGAILPIETDFADTYGLASAGLVAEVTRNGAAARSVTEPVPGLVPGSKSFTQTIEWSVSDHQLAEGDQLKLHAEATDFDNIAGPNLGKSTPVLFRIVSREELLADLNRREQEYRQDFERFVRRQEELFSDLLSSIRASGSPNDQPKHKQELAQLARRQRDLTGRVNMLRLQFEQVLSELRMNQLSTPNTEARLAEGVTQPMSELARAEMPKAADALDRLAQQTDPQVQQDARADQEAILRDMNRILANLVKWEGFQEAVSLLREVLKMQGEVGRQTEKRIEAEVLGTTTAPARVPAPAREK